MASRLAVRAFWRAQLPWGWTGPVDIISRKEALARGLTRYFTGEPCKHGHVAARLAINGGCVECVRNRREANPERERENRRKWAEANLEKVRESGRKWRLSNPERYRESGRKWRLSNPERYRENRRKWNEANPEKRREYARKWNEANPEKRRDWYEANPERHRESGRKWRLANPEKSRGLNRKWRLSNPERYRENRRKWNEANKHKKNACQMRRHATKLNATPSWLTQEQLDEMVAMREQTVIAEQLTGVPHHVDHIEPLRAKDRCGLHVPWNLQILTASENFSKGNRLAKHFHWKKL